MRDQRLLIDRILAGDDAAWRRFVNDHEPVLRATIARYVDDDEARADIFAETLCKLRDGRLASWRGRSSLRTWLWTLTRNVCRDWYRSARGTRHVLGILGALPPLEARFFRLFYLERLQFHEIVDALRLEFGASIGCLDLVAARDRVEEVARRKGLGHLLDRLLNPLPIAPRPRTADAPPPMLGDRGLLRRAFDDLADAVAGLPERDRTILTLRFVNRSSAREICEELDLGNVKKVYRRIERLRERLRDDLLSRGVPEEIYRSIVDNIVELAARDRAWSPDGERAREIFP